MRISRNAITLGGLCFLAGLLSWRILVVGLAEQYAAADTPDAAAAALGWRANHPAALYQRGQALAGRSPTAATALLQASVWNDPTNAMTYLALAELWASAGRLPEAIALVEAADVLGPMRSPALSRSAAFWFAHGRPELGLERWSVLLRTRPATAGTLFPVLLKLAGDPATRPLLLPLLEQVPDWWERFFAYAATHAPRPETVMFLYQGRARAGATPSPVERRVYLDRLWKDGRWLDAYLAWVGGLDERGQEGLGLLYNGGFELPITGIGFDWRIMPSPGALVETLEIYGSRGARSLHVAFEGRGSRFQHVHQPLYLESGRYQLQGRVRRDGLAPRQGLRWAVRCNRPDAQPLAATEAFGGKDDWQPFSLNFEVPAADCPVQVLRLEQEDEIGVHWEGQGGVWFDDLTISRGG
ncbi:hypothetical protein [uncultured Lamprocystis sp.]|uniref:tetratricopeptide repeat protein n=1 Tax=uncultured Lamprocystis sp. TaxID=543132 RepID=UPI0025F33635|nr:hypothetical protein [uncultured Lamprocystis sp.]